MDNRAIIRDGLSFLYFLVVQDIFCVLCLLGKDVLRNSVNNCVLHRFADLHSNGLRKPDNSVC